jgi:homospermidine synthase
VAGLFGNFGVVRWLMCGQNGQQAQAPGRLGVFWAAWAVTGLIASRAQVVAG